MPKFENWMEKEEKEKEKEELCHFDAGYHISGGGGPQEFWNYDHAIQVSF